MDLPLPWRGTNCSCDAPEVSTPLPPARRAPHSRPQHSWRRLSEPERQRDSGGACCSTRGQPHRRRERDTRGRAAAAGAAYGAEEPFPEGGGAQGGVESAVFPRIRERDPYRLLGISREASYEEVQAARNYLWDTFRHHQPSQEAVDLALDKILESSYRARHKFGFQPPQSGRKGDLKGDAPRLSWGEQLRERFEPDVPRTTLVNDGTIFLALAVWAAFQPRDPTFPIFGAVGYALYRFAKKRKDRNPEGPFLGGTPLWGAILATALAVAVGVVLGTLSAVVFKAGLGPLQGPGLVNLLLCLTTGLASIYLK